MSDPLWRDHSPHHDLSFDHDHEHEPDIGPPASFTTRVLLAAGVVVALVVGAGTTWWLFSQTPPAPAGQAAAPTGPCSETLLHVVAAPEIAPVVREAAHSISPGGGCGPIAVTAQEPAATARS